MLTLWRTLFCLLLISLGSITHAQKAYFELSRYIDNGNPINPSTKDVIDQSDVGINRLYHYGIFSYQSSIQNYYTTNGTNVGADSTHKHIFFMVTDTLGNTIYSTLINFGPGFSLNTNLYAKDGDVYLYGNTDCDSLNTTNFSDTITSPSGSRGYVIKISGSSILSNSSTLDYATYIGKKGSNVVRYVQHDGNTLWTLLATSDSTLYTTQPTGSNYGTNSVYLLGISNSMMASNASLNTSTYARYFAHLNPNGLISKNGNLYMVGLSTSSTFSPLTVPSPSPMSTIFLKISSQTLNNNLSFTAANGNYSTFLPIQSSFAQFGKTKMVYSNGKIFMAGKANGTVIPFTNNYYPFSNSSLVVIALTETTMNGNATLSAANGDYFAQVGYYASNVENMEIYDGDFYISGIKNYTASVNIPGLTNTNPYTSGPMAYIQKIDSLTLANNDPPNTTPADWVQYFGTPTQDMPKFMKVNKNGVHVLMAINGTIQSSQDDLPITYPEIAIDYNEFGTRSAYVNLCLDGYINYISYLSEDEHYGNSVAVSDYATYFTGVSKATSTYPNNYFDEPRFPTTTPTSNWGTEANEHVLQKIVYAPESFIQDTLSPLTQTVCQFGSPDPLTAPAPILPSDSLPKLYIDNQAIDQYISISSVSYQWQQSNSPSGPWTDIAGAQLQSYIPTVSTFNKYYRRKSFLNTCSIPKLIAISVPAAVLVNNLVAPTVDAGGIIYTCPGVTVNLGGSPTAQGGLAPYTYTWDFGLPAVANPTITTSQSAIVNLTVTDANNCVRDEQATVITVQANAGNDVYVCDTNGVQIGHPVPGIPGITFSWDPTQDLSCSNCPTPLASPLTPTQYVLTQTLTLNNGNTCTTYDTVQVGNIGSPGVDFAGPDQYLCNYDNISLGTTPVAGYNYLWSPNDPVTNPFILNTNFLGSYLYNNGSQNPMTITVTATNNNCVYTDDVTIYHLTSNAGPNICDSGTIGVNVFTPNINEQYSWTVVSGSGYITGPTNTSQTTAVGSPSGPTVFELTTTANGQTCTSQVTIDDCAVSPPPAGGTPSSPIGCPSALLTQDTITLTASSGYGANVTYEWTPQNGLSSYTDPTVILETTQHITYMIVMTDSTNALLSDTAYIEVNNPNWTLPVIDLVDTLICRNESVNLVHNFNNSYFHAWSTLNTSPFSNPSVTPYSTVSYPVTVTDPVSGCMIQDTAYVQVDNFTLYYPGGSDWNICGNSTIQLGEPADSNFTYEWSPGIAPWQNGTDQFTADPYVNLSNSTQFVLTYTSNLNSCVFTDTVNVTVSNQPIAPSLQNVGVCLGSSTVIGEPGISGVEYSWSPATGLSCTDCPQPYVTPNGSATYTLTLSYANSAACPDSSSATITVFSSDPSFVLNDITYCNDGTPTDMMNANPPVGYNSYSWSPQNLFSNSNIMAPTANFTSGTYQVTLYVQDSLGCYSNGTLTATSNVDIPNAGVDKTVCINNMPVSLGSTYNTGNLSWSPATGLSSTTSGQTYFTTTTPGNYQFVVTNTSGNCTESDTVNVTVNPLPGTSTNSSTLICNNSCTDIGLNSTNGYSYQWAPSTGLSSTNTAMTTACLTSSQQYTLTVTDQNNCSQTHNYNVNVNATPAPTVSLQSVTACITDSVVPINYQVNPSSGNYVFSWTPNTVFVSQSATTPSIQNLTPGVYDINLTVTDQNTGCQGDADAQLTMEDCSILDTCEVDFNVSLSSVNLCSNDTLNFTITSDSIPVSYNWNYFGNSQSGFGTGANGQIIYTNNTTAEDTIFLTIDPNIGNCYLETIDTLVFVYPPMLPNFTGNGIYCSGDSALITVDDDFVSYDWNGNVSTDTSAYFTIADNPILLIFTDANNCVFEDEINVMEQNHQTYYDTLHICEYDSVDINGVMTSTPGDYIDTNATAMCDSITILHLIVHPAPVVNNNVSLINLCSNDSITLNLTGATDYYYNNMPIPSDYVFETDSAQTFYFVGEDQYGCVDTASVEVQLVDPDSIYFNAPILVCGSYEGDLSMNASGTLSNCYWDITNASNYNGCNPTVSINNAGCYDVTFTALDQNGCTVEATATNYICIEETPTANFTYSPNPPTTISNQVQFTEQSDNAIAYEWMINGETYYGTSANYTFPNETEGSYQVCLITTSNMNCMDTNCIVIEIVDEFLLFVPNTFTPDGNEHNQMFTAQSTKDATSFQMQIFNRWGELIFESSDITIGWDGTYKGKMCQDGTYTWKIRINDGDNSEDQYYHGHVTLIR